MNISANPPRVHINYTRAAYVGPGLNLEPHKNAVATVAVSLESPFTLEFPNDRSMRPQVSDFAVIPPNTLHRLVANGAMVFFYLDALSDNEELFRQESPERDDARLVETIRSAVAASMNGQSRTELLPLFCKCLGVPTKITPQASVVAAVRAVDRQPRNFTSVAQAAEMAGLSASRFQHVFKEATGLSFRRYRLWKRMALVGRALTKGESLTEAALEAGFASSSHLSSAFKHMFGVTPSGLLALGTTFRVERGDLSATGPHCNT